MSKKIASFAACCALSSIALAEGILLVLPANVNMINLGFDLMRMKSPGEIEMMCYGGTDEVSSLEVFDRASYRWFAVPQSSWNDGSLPGASHSSLVIVGDSQAASDLLEAAEWADNIILPSGHNFHEVVNAVNTMSPLSKKQWQALEKNYGIKLREITVPSRYERQRPLEAGIEANAAEPILAPAEIIIVAPAETIVETAPTEEAPVEAPAPVETVEEAAPAEAVETAPVEAPAPAEAAQEAAEEAAEESAEPPAEKAEVPAKEAAPVVTFTVNAATQEAPVEKVSASLETPVVEIPAAPATTEAAPTVPVTPEVVPDEAPSKADAEIEAAKKTVAEALAKAQAEVEAAKATEAESAKAELSIPAPEVELPSTVKQESEASAYQRALELAAPVTRPSTEVKVPELPAIPSLEVSAGK